MANDQVAVAAPDPGQQVTQGFGESSVARVAETSSLALAEQAKAAVQARYIMAMQRPRDIERARKTLLADCRRPAFADSAIYNKPVGDGVEGPSIRMAEAAARAMGNIYADVAAIYDDREKRIVRVSATDLEANVTYPMDVTIAKTIERSRPQPGRKIVMVRKNSKGYDVFVIEATDEEILDKERSTASKALRTCLLRLIPGDILEEAMEQCYRTRAEEVAKELPKWREKMVVAYAAIGVDAQQLGEYLGHAISDATSAEIDTMRSLRQAIKDGETTWAAAVDHRRGGGGDKPAPAPVDKNLADVTERLKGKNGKPADVAPVAPLADVKTGAMSPEESARRDREDNADATQGRD